MPETTRSLTVETTDAHGGAIAQTTPEITGEIITIGETTGEEIIGEETAGDSWDLKVHKATLKEAKVAKAVKETKVTTRATTKEASTDK